MAALVRPAAAPTWPPPPLALPPPPPHPSLSMVAGALAPPHPLASAAVVGSMAAEAEAESRKAPEGGSTKERPEVPVAAAGSSEEATEAAKGQVKKR